MSLLRYIAGILLAAAVSAAGAADYRLTILKTGVGAQESAPAEPAAAPTLTAITPNQGPTAGGTVFTLFGDHFQSGATVSIGGAPAIDVSLISASELTAQTPTHSWGLTDITLTNPDSQSATLFGAFRYLAPPPAMLGVLPGSGSDLGGETVTVSGSGFLEGAEVSFGGTPASTAFVSDAELVVTTPARSWGWADVAVLNPDGQQANLPDGFRFDHAAPTLTVLDPSSGSTAGGALTLFGAQFLAGATVQVDGVPIPTAFTSATQLTATLPAHDWGQVHISVLNPDGQSTAALPYSFELEAPTLASVSPNVGLISGGDPVTLIGTGFMPGASVRFGGSVAQGVDVMSATELIATTPAHNAGAVTVEVVNPDGKTATLLSAFSYEYSAPTINEITPSSGLVTGGFPVEISGTGFRIGASVHFGAFVSPSVTVNSATHITAITPVGIAGEVDISVINEDGKSAELIAAFTYTNLEPQITAVNPSSGSTAGGALVTIDGANFLPGARVLFGSVESSSVTVSSSGLVEAVAPAQDWGWVDVTVINADNQSALMLDGFRYIHPAPAISGLSPAAGPTAGGQQVTITGANFLSGATVEFVGAAMVATTYVSSTQLTVMAPPYPGGSASTMVRVHNPDGRVSSGYGYSYIAPPPAISAVTPSSGLTTGGTSVTITGSGFDLDGANVLFGTTWSSSVTVHSSTQLTAIAPAGAAGTVSVTVTNSDGQSATKSSAFTYEYAAPTVSTVSPATGLTAGGTSVIITGTNFRSGATVKFGTTTAASVTVNSSTQITATSPAGAAGTVSVTVINSDGKAATKSSAFTYTAPPTIALISVPVSDAWNISGSPLYLTGNGFVAGATVRLAHPYGGSAYAAVTNVTSTRIDFVSNDVWTSAAYSGQGVTFTVTNPDGASASMTGGYDGAYDGV